VLRELGEAEGAMMIRLLMVMLMVVLGWRRSLPHAAHQTEGTADPPAAPGNGAGRHCPAALKHPEEPDRNVRLSHTLVPRREGRAP